VPSTYAGRSVSPWLKWGLPVTAVVLLAAVVGGLGARHLYGQPPKAVVTPASPVQTPVPQPGADTVVLSPAAAEHPDSRMVQSLLQIYFSAINNKRYDQWATTVVAEKQQELPEGKWRDAYATTVDGSITVYEIETGPNESLRVLLTFTSVQDPSRAPVQLRAPCVRWRVAYPLVQDSGGLRLDASQLPGSAAVDPCP
jgi:hypothetical protein